MRWKLVEFILIWIADFILCVIFGKLDVLLNQGSWVGLTILDFFYLYFLYVIIENQNRKLPLIRKLKY